LTRRGADRMRLAAKGMRALGVAPQALVTSPLTRCLQTADIVGEYLEVEPVRDERLRPGMRVDDVAEIHAEHPGVERLMVCGHQPDLSLLVGDLVGGALVDFRKGALAVLDVSSMRPAGASLRAFYPPRALRRLGAEGAA
ncbi:MAG: SixA phosphatase family protein, partial [Miltoncostaeaceae bacterium]